MLIFGNDGGFPFARNFDWDNFFCKEAEGLSFGSSLLAAERECILIFARNLKLFRDVFAGFRHGVDAVLFFQERINEAPADGGVVNVRRALKRRFSFGHHERSAGHRFNAARDGEINFTGCDGPCSSSHGIHPRGAQTIDGRAGDGIGKARQQKRHASDVAIVFPSLIGAAEKNFIEARPIDFRIALQQRANRNRGKVVCAHGGENSAEPPDWSSYCVANENGSGHLMPYAAGTCPCATAVRCNKSRKTFSSLSLGGTLSPTLLAKRISQPVAFWTCSRVTPG